MPETLHRATPADLEIRADGRTVVGIAVPFDNPTEIAERGRRFTEVFRRGAFSRTISERGGKVKFFAEHYAAGRLPVGRAHLLREDAAGLYSEFRVSQTRDGDETLELIRDGALDSLSIGFRPVPNGDRWNRARDLVERIEVKLTEVAAVAFPAYEGAAIVGVRSEHRVLPAEIARRRLALLTRNQP
jgi:HK97 family phage prohead protease